MPGLFQNPQMPSQFPSMSMNPNQYYACIMSSIPFCMPNLDNSVNSSTSASVPGESLAQSPSPKVKPKVEKTGKPKAGTNKTGPKTTSVPKSK